ncbi:MAG TPA: SDR family oxidoreductase [Burkholderiales bacterium]|nr:SDR family oxidoreductase [Burkholderiales bacterium]
MQTYESLLEHIRNRPRSWLVTGCAGFIGSHLIEHLLKLDQRVVGLDNFSTGSWDNLAQVKELVGEARWRNFRFIEGDIRDLQACREACRSVELVLHQAALGSVPRSIDDPIATNDSNVNGQLNMLIAARDAGVSRFVYASSSAIYGSDTTMPKVEASIGKPMSPYGLSKGVNELYAGVFATCYGFESIGLRYFNVFGPRQDPDGAYPSVIPAWIGALLRGQTAYINGDGTIARDFCHVDNVVQANLRAAMVENPAAVNQAYNVALGDLTSLTDLFEIIRDMMAKRLPHLKTVRAVYREPRRGDLPFSKADISKAQRLLGFEPRVRVSEGLESTIDWYAEHLPMNKETRKLANA